MPQYSIYNVLAESTKFIKESKFIHTVFTPLVQFQIPSFLVPNTAGASLPLGMSSKEWPKYLDSSPNQSISSDFNRVTKNPNLPKLYVV